MRARSLDGATALVVKELLMSEQAGSVFDYVVVGGGLAGCAVAARLSENPGARVVLIEAGDENRYEQSYYATGAPTTRNSSQCPRTIAARKVAGTGAPGRTIK